MRIRIRKPVGSGFVLLWLLLAVQVGVAPVRTAMAAGDRVMIITGCAADGQPLFAALLTDSTRPAVQSGKLLVQLGHLAIESTFAFTSPRVVNLVIPKRCTPCEVTFSADYPDMKPGYPNTLTMTSKGLNLTGASVGLYLRGDNFGRQYGQTFKSGPCAL